MAPDVPDMWGDPNYYSVIEHNVINTTDYDRIPGRPFKNRIILLSYLHLELEAPQSDPLCVYHYAGIKRYLWRDRVWSEYDLDRKYIFNRSVELILKSSTTKQVTHFARIRQVASCYPNYYNLTLKTNVNISAVYEVD